jgi:hypothetical protein
MRRYFWLPKASTWWEQELMLDTDGVPTVRFLTTGESALLESAR